MTKEEKQLRKHLRCDKRRIRRKVSIDRISRYMAEGLSFTQAKSHYRHGFFLEYGKERQVCSWYGICDYPCNGDC